MTGQTPADRARAYRARVARNNRRQPRTPSDEPLARARRRLRNGAKATDLDDDERRALYAYQVARRQARRRGD